MLGITRIATEYMKYASYLIYRDSRSRAPLHFTFPICIVGVKGGYNRTYTKGYSLASKAKLGQTNLKIDTTVFKVIRNQVIYS